MAALNDRLTAGQVALEVLGEISASIDGLVVDPDQEEEEWTGFGDGMEEDDASPPEIEMANGHPQPLLSLSSDTLTLLSALPARLIILAKPTTAGFAPSSEAQNVDTLPTDAQPSSSHLAVPPSTAALLPLVHLRALECLNNLFVTLARAIKPPPPAKGDDDEDDEMEEEVIAAAPEEARLPEGFAASAQSVWEGLFGIVLELQGTVLPQASVSTGKKAKVLPPLGSEELVHAVEAGLGAIWALARAHIDGLVCLGRLCGGLIGADLAQTIGQSETPFLLSVIASTAPPISNESKQRAIGALGVLAARAGVSHKENKVRGLSRSDVCVGA